MCYCGTVKKDGFYQCCQDQITMNQESRFNSGDMSKMEMVEFLKTPEEKAQAKKEIAKFMEKGEKNKVASAYMPKVKFEKLREEWERQVDKGHFKLEVPANETPREELLQRDVGILFKENRKLKEENEILLERASILLEQNKKLFDSFQRLYKQNELLTEKVGKQDADL